MKCTILQILLSCTVTHGLRPSYVNYRRQEVTTVESSPLDVQTETQTIVAESMDSETENNQTPEKETGPPMENTEIPADSQETENPAEKTSQQPIIAEETENQTVSQNVQEEVTSESQNEETETTAPVELQTDSTITTDAELEFSNSDSKPTEAALDNEAVEKEEEAEPEPKQQNPENEAQQNEPEQELNDQEAKIESEVYRARTNDQKSIIERQDPNESEPPKLAELMDRKDADITMKAVDHTNENQVSDIEIKRVVSKYFNSVPDIKSQYILNEGLAKSITHYFKNKVVALPLFHINMKIDRNLVKIPWETGPPQQLKKKGSYPYRVLPDFKKSQ